MSSPAVAYTWQGIALVRATTLLGAADVPRTLDLDDPVVTRTWLSRTWQREDVRAVLCLASPALVQAVDSVLGGSSAGGRDVRRAALSTAAYLLRWQHRPTPLGLFAGVATAAVDPKPGARWGGGHRATVLADSEWTADLIKRLHRSAGLLERLPLVANNAARARGDRLVVPGPPSDSRDQVLGPIELSVRNRRSVIAAMDAARLPVSYRTLHATLQEQFPNAPTATIDALLTELVQQQVLRTSLTAPMTMVNALDHLCAELDKHAAHQIPDVQHLVDEVRAIGNELSTQQPATTDRLAGLGARMKAVTSITETPLRVDTTLDCDVRLPAAVFDEVSAAATAVYRTTPHPYGHWRWLDYHNRFRARYGPGAAVPVMDLVSDSGLGLPTGYAGAARESMPQPRTDRDNLVLALVEQTLMQGSGELLLTDDAVCALEEAAGSSERLWVPRAEVSFEVHAATTMALAQGDFRVLLTTMPRSASSMAGRFAHLLPAEDQDRLAATYDSPADTIRAQLVFGPRRARNENVTRTLQLLPHLLELSAAGSPAPSSIPLADVAVTADARSLHLVQLSTGRTIHLHVVHALEAGTQTPPLARFLAEVGTARCALYRPFDYGAAARLPYLPRVRYRRTTVLPAHWRLTSKDLPGPRATTAQWSHALDAWRERLHVPDQVAVMEYDQRLPVDLTHPVHRQLLRAHLRNLGTVEIRESTDGDTAHGWAGRATEFWIPLALQRPRVPTPSAPVVPIPCEAPHLPGAGNILHAQIHAHPLRFTEILLHHLPQLLTPLGDSVTAWWFTRSKELSRPDAEQTLALTLHLQPGAYAAAAEHLHRWASGLYRTDLARGLTLGTYQPQTGRFGHGTAMDAAHDLFAHDSTVALAQLACTEAGVCPPQALTAASILHLVCHLAAMPEEGEQWLVDNLPRTGGALDRTLRDQTLQLTSPHEPALLDASVAAAWEARADAAHTYRNALAGQRDPLTTARSLLHQHHVRTLGGSTDDEALTTRLVRAAALHRRKRAR